MQVEVLEARDIPRMDKMGSSDPSVDIFTDPKRKLTTKTMKNTLNPKWKDETHFLMVQARRPPARALMLGCKVPHCHCSGSALPGVSLTADVLCPVTQTSPFPAIDHTRRPQEPESQVMRFEMHDVDMVNVKQLLKVNIIKGATNVFQAKESMGKGFVDLRSVCVGKPGETVTQWFPLGSEDWSADDGPVRPTPLLGSE